MKRLLLSLFALTFPLLLCAGTLQGSVTTTYNVVAHATPTTALPVAVTPVFTDGAHLIKVAYVTAAGVSTLSASGVSRTTDAAHTAITVSLVASTNPSVTGINVYGTRADEVVNFYYIGNYPNTTGDVDVGALDAALTVAAPIVDTSMTDTVINVAGVTNAWTIWLINHDVAVPVYMSFDGTVVDTTGGPYLAAGEKFPIDYPVYLPGGGSIRLRSTTAGVAVSYVLFPK